MMIIMMKKVRITVALTLIKLGLSKVIFSESGDVNVIPFFPPFSYFKKS